MCKLTKKILFIFLVSLLLGMINLASASNNNSDSSFETPDSEIKEFREEGGSPS